MNMLPKTLKLQAFGPYVEEQIIDFSAFEKDHLFLIRGETGSGKTMLLDAITYALYGKSSGGQREDLESMRSRFAADDMDTIVDFTFLLNEKEYRFYRKVEVRHKRNEEKVWKVSVDAGELIDGNYHPFFENPKRKNVEAQAEMLIGLSYEQFVQVIMLPQGKFEQFLTSKSEEKQEILKTLFQMEKWQNISEYLVEKLRLEKLDIDEKKQQIQVLLQSIEESSWEDVKQQWEVIRTNITCFGKQTETLDTQIQDVQQRILHQNEIQSWKTEAKKLEDEEKCLQLQEVKVKEHRQAIRYWKKAEKLVFLYQNFLIQQQHCEERKAEVEASKQVLEAKTVEFEQEETRITMRNQFEKEFAKLHEKQRSLVEATAIYEQFAKVSKEIVQAANVAEQASLQTKQWKAKMEALSALEDSLIKEKEKLQKYIDDHHVEIQTWQKYTQAYQIWQRMKKSQQDSISNELSLKAQLVQMEVFEDTHKRIKKEHDIMYQAFLNSSAAQLSEVLEEHQPCPVCGSLEHPGKNHVQAVFIDLNELKKQKAMLDEAQQMVVNQELEVHKTTSTRDAFQSAIQELKNEIQVLLHKDFDEKEYDALLLVANEYQAKKDKIESINTQLEVCRKDMKGKQVQGDTLIAEQNSKQQAVTLLQVKQDSFKSRLIDCIDSLDKLNLVLKTTVEDEQRCKLRIDAITQQIQSSRVEYEKAKQAIQTSEVEYQNIVTVTSKIELDLNNKCNEQQIQLDDIVHLGDEQQISKLEQLVHNHEVSLQQNNAQQIQIEKRLRLQKEENIEELQANYEALKTELLTLQEEYAKLASKRDMYAKIVKKIEKVQEELNHKEPQFFQMQHFVRAFRGDNSIGIERYVLGIMLNGITQYANQLLLKVHNGRYQIYRSEQASGRTRKYGLELAIYDSYSMAKRNVVSLSGGEKFLVSLAMSLSLSTILQARNGGIRLDAMFIDEGFGTLDEHSIADALVVLQTMANTHGIVGIISHVEILKENIPAGIEIIKSRKGSCVQVRKV